MNKKMTFQQLEERKLELREKLVNLGAQISGITESSQRQQKGNDHYTELVHELQEVKHSIRGVETELSNIGHTYVLKYSIEQKEIYTIELLVENQFNNPLTINDKEQIRRFIHSDLNYEILAIEYVKKPIR